MKNYLVYLVSLLKTVSSSYFFWINSAILNCPSSLRWKQSNERSSSDILISLTLSISIILPLKFSSLLVTALTITLLKFWRRFLAFLSYRASHQWLVKLHLNNEDESFLYFKVSSIFGIKKTIIVDLGCIFKISVRFLTNEVRADALDIKVFYKKCNQVASCKVSQKTGSLVAELKKEILTKATVYKKERKDKNFREYKSEFGK